MPAAVVLAPVAFAVADLLIYWSGFEVVWKLGVVLVLGYVMIGIFMAFDPQRPPLDWKSAHVAAGLADRHGHHLLAGPVQRRGGATSTRCRRPTPSTSGSGGTSWSSSAFSVAIYFWAMRTKLPREEMLALVNKQGGGEEELPPAIRH